MCGRVLRPVAMPSWVGRTLRLDLDGIHCTSSEHVVAAVRKADGTPISIPYLVDLEHDHRKPSDSVLDQLATVLQVEDDVLFFLEGRRPLDLQLGKVDPETLRDARCARRGAIWMARRPLMNILGKLIATRRKQLGLQQSSWLRV
jgi:hypothetical protein